MLFRSTPFLSGTQPKQGCGMEHPPAPPEDEVGGDEPGDDAEGEPGKPHKHESLWKRKAREAEEKAAAEGLAPPTP